MLGAALALAEMPILRKVIHWPALALYSTLLAASFTLLIWGFQPDWPRADVRHIRHVFLRATHMQSIQVLGPSGPNCRRTQQLN